MDGKMDEWMDVWMNERITGWMEGEWVDKTTARSGIKKSYTVDQKYYINIYFYFLSDPSVTIFSSESNEHFVKLHLIQVNILILITTIY